MVNSHWGKCEHIGRWHRQLFLSKCKGEDHHPTKDQVQDSFIKGLHSHTFGTVTEPTVRVSCPIIATLFLHFYVPQINHNSIHNINTFMTSDPLPIWCMVSICKQCYWHPINKCLFAQRCMRRFTVWHFRRRCCTSLTCVQQWQVQSQIALWKSTTQKAAEDLMAGWCPAEDWQLSGLGEFGELRWQKSHIIFPLDEWLCDCNDSRNVLSCVWFNYLVNSNQVKNVDSSCLKDC